MSKKKNPYKIKSYTPGSTCPTKKQGYKDRKNCHKKDVSSYSWSLSQWKTSHSSL